MPRQPVCLVHATISVQPGVAPHCCSCSVQSLHRQRSQEFRAHARQSCAKLAELLGEPQLSSAEPPVPAAAAALPADPAVELEVPAVEPEVPAADAVPSVVAPAVPLAPPSTPLSVVIATPPARPAEAGSPPSTSLDAQ